MRQKELRVPVLCKNHRNYGDSLVNLVGYLRHLLPENSAYKEQKVQIKKIWIYKLGGNLL